MFQKFLELEDRDPNMCVQESKSEADVPVVVLNNITAYWDKVTIQHNVFEYKPYYYFKQKAYSVMLIKNQSAYQQVFCCSDYTT